MVDISFFKKSDNEAGNIFAFFTVLKTGKENGLKDRINRIILLAESLSRIFPFLCTYCANLINGKQRDVNRKNLVNIPIFWLRYDVDGKYLFILFLAVKTKFPLGAKNCNQ